MKISKILANALLCSGVCSVASADIFAISPNGKLEYFNNDLMVKSRIDSLSNPHNTATSSVWFGGGGELSTR